MKRLSADLEAEYPNLFSEGYEVTSRKTRFDDPNCEHFYNCLAFAADVNTIWWEPDGESYWPISKLEYTLTCYIEAYRAIGYEKCDDSGLENGFEKIVIYAVGDDPTHAAKQLPDGRWKSKLGQQEDIEHKTTKALENSLYGNAVQYMRRAIK